MDSGQQETAWSWYTMPISEVIVQLTEKWSDGNSKTEREIMSSSLNGTYRNSSLILSRVALI